MTILEAIARADALAPNTVPQADKLRWLSMLDALAHGQVLASHEGALPPWEPYGPGTSLDTQLVITGAREEIYLHWLTAWIHYHQAETALYNEAMLLYSAAWKAYVSEINRSRMPLGRQHKYF